MGNKQLEDGNIDGERTCWRTSSSAVGGAERDNRGSDVLIETCERSRKSARPNQGQGRKERGNRFGVEAKAL